MLKEYTCPHCHNKFSGKLPKCPKCHAHIKYSGEEIKAEEVKKAKNEELKQVHVTLYNLLGFILAMLGIGFAFQGFFTPIVDESALTIKEYTYYEAMMKLFTAFKDAGSNGGEVLKQGIIPLLIVILFGVIALVSAIFALIRLVTLVNGKPARHLYKNGIGSLDKYGSLFLEFVVMALIITSYFICNKSQTGYVTYPYVARLSYYGYVLFSYPVVGAILFCFKLYFRYEIRHFTAKKK